MCKPTCSSLTKWLLTPFYSTLHPEKHWKSTNIGDDDYVCCFDEILKRMITKKKLTVQSAGPCSSCHRLRCCCGSVCRICQTKHKTNHVPHQSFSTRLHKHTTQIDRERERERKRKFQVPLLCWNIVVVIMIIAFAHVLVTTVFARGGKRVGHVTAVRKPPHHMNIWHTRTSSAEMMTSPKGAWNLPAPR